MASKCFIALFAITYLIAIAQGTFNPCRNYRHGDQRYMIKDPLDCTKYYSCSSTNPHHMSCAAGTVFDQEFLGGSCTWPNARNSKNCKKPKGRRYKSKFFNKNNERDKSSNFNHLQFSGYYNPWSEWSSCSVTCGQGIQSRERTCWGKDYFTEHDEYFCIGESTQQRACHMQDCRGKL